jgi:hypothetical protein
MKKGRVQPEDGAQKVSCLECFDVCVDGIRYVFGCLFIVSVAFAFAFSVIAFHLLMHDCNCSSLGRKSHWSRELEECKEDPYRSCCIDPSVTEFDIAKDYNHICHPKAMRTYKKMGGAERGWLYLDINIGFVVLFGVLAIFIAVSRANIVGALSDEYELLCWYSPIVYGAITVTSVFVVIFWAAGIPISMISYGLVLYWIFFFNTVLTFAMAAFLPAKDAATRRQEKRDSQEWRLWG